MRRSLSVLAALGLLARAGAAQAAPTPYADQENRYQITVPDGWQMTKRADGGLTKLMVTSGDGRVECNVTIDQPANIATASQAWIDASFRRGEADDVAKAEIENMGLKYADYQQTRIERDGHPAVYASLMIEDDGRQIRLRKLFMAAAGRVYNFNCTIFAAEEGQYAADLDALYASIHLTYS